MATAIVKRLKNGAVHYAAAVGGSGVVSSWSDSEAKAVPVTPELGKAMEAHYRGKLNAGTIVFMADGKEVGRIETPTEPPPSPGALVKLRALLGLKDDVTADRVAAAAIEELEAYRGTAEGPSPFVKVDADAEEIAELRKALEEAKTGPAVVLPVAHPALPEAIDVLVSDEALDVLMAGESTTLFVPFGDGNLTVSLTRPTAFKVGDRVRCSLPGSWLDGREATITELNVTASDGVTGHGLKIEGVGVSVTDPSNLTLITADPNAAE